MKSKKTLLLAASILALTLSAFPHVAAASERMTVQAGSDMFRKAGGTNCPYLQVILAAGNLLSALLP
jgi:ABC-type oligopeptide transport system substrate-binding subunit